MWKFLETIDVTVIVATIAAIAAIVAPCITEILRQRGIRREKSIECYLTAKTEAYASYLRIVSRLRPSPSLKELQDLADAMNQAILFSSKDTGRKIALHTKNIKDWSHQEPSDEAGWNAYDDAYLEMLSALHSELGEYQK